MKIGVLALQGDFLEHLEVVRHLSAEAIPIRLPGELDGLDGLIIPGGESTTITHLAQEYGLASAIKEKAQKGMPLMGTCAGMILMSRGASDLDHAPLGLIDIEVQRNAFGRQVDSFEADLQVAALGEPPLHAIFIRAPIIQRVGPGVEVLARLTNGTPVAAQQGKILVTAFHPELTPDLRFHSYFLRLTARRDGGEA